MSPAALEELQTEDQCEGSGLVRWTSEAGALPSAPGETDVQDPTTWRNQAWIPAGPLLPLQGCGPQSFQTQRLAPRVGTSESRGLASLKPGPSA